MTDYLDIVYDKKLKPLTSYPEKLVSYIIDVCKLEVNCEKTLLELGVGRGEHLRIFKSKGFKQGDFPVSENYAETSLSIPIYFDLKKKDILKVTNLIKNFFV